LSSARRRSDSALSPVAGPRAGVGDQDHVACVVAAPIDLTDGLGDSGIGVLAETLARDRCRLHLPDPRQEFLAVAAVREIGVRSSDVSQARHGRRAVPVGDESEADPVGEPGRIDRGVHFLHNFVSAFNVGSHRDGRVDDEDDSGAVRCHDVGSVLQRHRRNSQQSALLAANQHILVIEDRNQVELAADVDVALGLDGDDRRIRGVSGSGLFAQPAIGLGVVLVDQRTECIPVAEEEHALMLLRIPEAYRQRLPPVDGLVRRNPAAGRADAVGTHFEPGAAFGIVGARVDVKGAERRHRAALIRLTALLGKHSARYRDHPLIERAFSFLQ